LTSTLFPRWSKSDEAKSQANPRTLYQPRATLVTAIVLLRKDIGKVVKELREIKQLIIRGDPDVSLVTGYVDQILAALQTHLTNLKPSSPKILGRKVK
jgi:hypothetical protein